MRRRYSSVLGLALTALVGACAEEPQPTKKLTLHLNV